jgi:hypothetical protein
LFIKQSLLPDGISFHTTVRQDISFITLIFVK